MPQPVPPQIAKFMGPTWGPPGADRTNVGPMLAPWTLLSGAPLYPVPQIDICKLYHIRFVIYIFKINTHRCWNWHHVHSRQVVSCPVQPRARHWSCVFWRDFRGVKRTCWTTGSWRSCLSLEVVSSIPAWSTIIYRFLCGFICVSLCQSIKIKPTNMYIPYIPLNLFTARL